MRAVTYCDTPCAELVFRGPEYVSSCRSFLVPPIRLLVECAAGGVEQHRDVRDVPREVVVRSLESPGAERDAAQCPTQLPHGPVQFLDRPVDGAGHVSAS